jgi:GNAT superfamily N-acetyltransferase
MWQCVRYRPEDLPEAVLLAREHYGESWISNADFLQWQYEGNPAGPAVGYVARDVEDGGLAGQYLVIPMDFFVDGDIVPSVLSLNTLTREAYRGQGVFTGLAKATYQECRDQGFDFCYGFPNPNSYHGLTKTLGFADLGRVPLLVRPLDVRAMVRSRWGALASAIASPAGLFFRVGERVDPEYEVVSLGATQLDEIEAFWARVRGKYPIMGVRDRGYVRWRYFYVPSREYVVYGIRKRDGGRLLGYVVGRCADVLGISAGMIVDLLVEQGLPVSAGRLLVDRALRELAARGASLAGSLMLAHTEEYRILKASGFFRCPRRLEPQPFPLCYLRLSAGLEPPRDRPDDLTRWFMTMGDYDVI